MTAHTSYDHSRKGIWFGIEIDNEEFVAFITVDALAVHFRSSGEKGCLVRAYKANRDVIETAAREKFLSGFARPVRLSVGDF